MKNGNILQIVAVRDLAMDAFMRPFFVPTLGVALRSFAQEVNRPAEDNAMYQKPSDFELWHLGEWDEGNGAFSQAALRIARAEEYKQAPPAPPSAEQLQAQQAWLEAQRRLQQQETAQAAQHVNGRA